MVRIRAHAQPEQLPSEELMHSRGQTDARTWDMAVVGAGPAGSVCAHSALATSPRMRVALIDRDRFPRDKACGDAVSTIAAQTLRELDLGAIFEGRPVISRYELTNPPLRQQQHMAKGPDNESEAGKNYYIVERNVFDHYLCAAAMTRGARDYTGYKLTNAVFDEGERLWNITLRERTGAVTGLRCRTLVGADGVGSRVRQLMGIQYDKTKHTAFALRAYARATGMAEDVMRVDWLDSLSPGYGWTFPLGAGKVNIGVGIDSRDFKRAGRRLNSYLDEYVLHLNRRGVAICDLHNAMTHPLLGSSFLPLVPQRQVGLVGDAAAMINPLNGEGIHYGIWAGASLGRAVGDCVNRNGSVDAALESYAQAYGQQFGEDFKRCVNLLNWIRFRKLFLQPSYAADKACMS